MVEYNYGRKLKRLLEGKGMRQVELAEKLGVTPAFISQLILRKRTPGRDTLFKIADALEIPVEELLPEQKVGRVPILFSFTGKVFCEVKPEHWKDRPLGYLPIPSGYSVRGTESGGIFAVSVDNDRLYPALRSGMKVYLKPVDIVKPKDGIELFMCRADDGTCVFIDVKSNEDKLIIVRDLLTGHETTYESTDVIPGSLYKVIAISLQ